MSNGIISNAQEPTRNEQVSVGVTSSVICNARQGMAPRKVLVVRNNSNDPTKIITINLGANPAVANNGIILRQYESFTDSTESGYDCFQGSVTAISAVAGGSLSIFER